MISMSINKNNTNCNNHLRPAIGCFKKASNKKEQTLVSPEYKVTDRMKTRNQSKREENPGSTHSTDSENEELSEVTHNAVNPCPEPIEVEKFKILSDEEKTESIINILNQLCIKITED